MKIWKKAALGIFFTFATLFFGANMQADAAYYVTNYHPNSCISSRTVCTGPYNNHCTTYCNVSHVYDASWNYAPGVTFSYSTPNVSFSISNEYVGLNVVKINGRPAVYRHKTYYSGRPIVSHKPIHNVSRPIHRPGHINNTKPTPNKPNAHRANHGKPARH